MRFPVLLLLPVLSFAQPCDTASSHKRYAFVVGNWNYEKTKLPSLRWAQRDSLVMKDALEKAGFDVTRIENADMPALLHPNQDEFLERVKPGDLVFFYYSGHVVQVVDDDFVLPVNFEKSKKVTEGAAFSLNRFLEDLNERKPGLTIMMIEGPHATDGQILGARTGLIIPDITNSGEILFAMSAEEQRIIASGPPVGPSLFTKTVAERLGEPGLLLGELFDQARQEVIRQSDRSQIPSVKSLVTSNFCFREPIPVKPTIVFQTIPIPTNKKDHEEYVRIQHNTFKMGCVPGDDRCKVEEKPQHEVGLTEDFWIGRNEVQVGSFQLYWAVAKKKKKLPRSAPQQDYNGWKVNNLPMVRVSWEEAQDYCTWVGGRLPTEAEWEYVARAGAADEIYPLNSANSRDKANFDGVKGNDNYTGVAPVKKFDANKFNVYDMSGNVWEWVADWYGPYVGSPSMDPKGPATGKEHIVRGGSFESDWTEHLRLSLRVPQKGENFKTGFRCVLPDTEDTLRLFQP